MNPVNNQDSITLSDQEVLAALRQFHATILAGKTEGGTELSEEEVLETCVYFTLGVCIDPMRAMLTAGQILTAVALVKDRDSEVSHHIKAKFARMRIPEE